jgi:predicted TPR repeat methyltransferase
MSSFDKKAYEWDSKPMRVERAHSVANHIKKYLKDKDYKVAMEYGCGTGLLGFLLKDNFNKLYMADTSKAMLEVLQDKINSSNITNMYPINLDILTEDFDENVDVIFSLMVLHHIKDIDMILKKWVSILKDNSLLIISDIDKEDGTYHKDGNTEHNGIDRDGLVEKLKSIGLKNISSETAYVVRKEVNGKMKDFPVFLVVAEK